MPPDLVRQPLAVDYSLPDFTFTVDGEVYSLRYDFGAFRAYEKLTGVNPFTPAFEISSKNLDTLLWAGLRHKNSEVTIEQIQTWLTPSTSIGLLDLAGDAFYGAFPKAETEQVPADPPSA